MTSFPPAIAVHNLYKTYKDGLNALTDINLTITKGEIFALLGPNGAGKTTLISTICGIVQPSSGSIKVMGHDNQAEYRTARSLIGLVPQELTTDAFETVWNTVSFSRGLFGKPSNATFIQKILQQLSLWDKKDSQLRTLSGGMKRRVMIAKALSHEPAILFLDEPSAGVDVDLRKSMWAQVRALRDAGVTIILTTHYLEEAEAMADRIGIINKGQLLLTESKLSLMERLGKKELVLELVDPLPVIPAALATFNLHIAQNGTQLVLTYDPMQNSNTVSDLIDQLKQNGIRCKDIQSRQSSLEDIFIQLVGAA